ncbi:MAG: prephenate dehydratase [Pirellulales bacterium]|nr:prephenate dehydratase [Pirellulales bacterium]
MSKSKSQSDIDAATKKKTVRSGNKTVTPSPRELAEIDRELLRLLRQRAEKVLEVARESGAAGQKALAAALTGEQLQQLAGEIGGPLSQRSVEAVIREIVSGCRALVRAPRIAILGPLYSFSHLAAIHRFGQSVEFVPVGNIAAVFEEVRGGHADYGLAPIENSTDGRIADTLDMFIRLPVRITGEIDLKIHHALLGKCPRAEVKEIYSKPQAISQCRNWLAKHLPGARTIEVTSTSTAAQLASEKSGAAAIAGIQAGVHYGLDVLAEKIEDNPGNLTRFAVIGGEPPARTGNDRTAILLEIEHRPGALAEAMMIFKRNRLNMTWIESFPIPGSKRGYFFFVEMEAHESDGRFRKAVGQLLKKTLRLEILGSFPAATTVE